MPGNIEFNRRPPVRTTKKKKKKKKRQDVYKIVLRHEAVSWMNNQISDNSFKRAFTSVDAIGVMESERQAVRNVPNQLGKQWYIYALTASRGEIFLGTTSDLATAKQAGQLITDVIGVPLEMK